MIKDCIFCKIVKGEISCHKVFEDEDVLVFLDVYPSVDGHTLIVSKKHSKNLFDTDKKILNKMIEVSKKIALMMKENLEVDGVNVVNNSGKSAGQEVEHIHFHILPRFELDERKLFLHGKEKLNKNFEEVLKKIKGEKNESR